MKLKSAAIFTGIYLIRYDIVHLASARHRVLFSIHKLISDQVSRLGRRLDIIHLTVTAFSMLRIPPVEFLRPAL